MTQEKILQYNKRCAEFLTISEEIENELIAYPEQQYSPLCSYANAAYITDKEDNPENTVWNYCKFHSDWNWIMEVVEAIEKVGYESLTGGSEYYYPEKGMRYIQSFIKDDITIYQEAKSKKEAIVQAINQFLIWYNNGQNT